MTDRRNIFFKVFEYLFISVIILNFQSVWMYTFNFSLIFKKILILLLVISAFGMIIFNGKILKSDFNKTMFISALLVILLGAYVILQPNGRVSALKNFIPALLIFFLVSIQKDVIDLFKIYKKLLVIIAVVSIFFWVFGSILQIIKPNLTMISTWTGSDGNVKSVLGYFGVYYETQRINLAGINCVRNSAIFTEAPMAAFAFSIALGIEELICKNRHKLNSVVLCIAIITTTSSTGIIYMILLYFFKYFGKENKYKLSKNIKILLIPFLMILLFYFLYCIVMQKLTYNSGNLRIDDFVAGYKTWLTAPLFGVGISNFTPIIANLSLWRRGVTGLSNSIAPLFAEGGLYVASIYIFCFGIGIYRCMKGNDYQVFVFIILYLFIFIITISPFNYLTFFMLSAISTYKLKGERVGKEKKTV